MASLKPDTQFYSLGYERRHGNTAMLRACAAYTAYMGIRGLREWDPPPYHNNPDLGPLNPLSVIVMAL